MGRGAQFLEEKEITADNILEHVTLINDLIGNGKLGVDGKNAWMAGLELVSKNYIKSLEDRLAKLEAKDNSNDGGVMSRPPSYVVLEEVINTSLNVKGVFFMDYDKRKIHFRTFIQSYQFQNGYKLPDSVPMPLEGNRSFTCNYSLDLDYDSETPVMTPTITGFIDNSRNISFSQFDIFSLYPTIDIDATFYF